MPRMMGIWEFSRAEDVAQADPSSGVVADYEIPSNRVIEP